VNVAAETAHGFTITANANYHLDSLIVDGVKSPSASSYTFLLLRRTIRPHNLGDQHVCDHFDSGSNGSISPLGTTAVNAGDSLKFTLTANANYHIDSLYRGWGIAGGGIELYVPYRNGTHTNPGSVP